MNESNSIETLINTPNLNLSDQTKFRLNEINKTKEYFNSKIRERKLASKKLSKYIAAFDYTNKILIVTTGSISISSFGTIIGAPVGIANVSFTLVFSLTTRIIKKLLRVTRKKKGKTIKLLC